MDKKADYRLSLTEEVNHYGKMLAIRIQVDELKAAVKDLNEHEKAFVFRWAVWLTLPVERIQKIADTVKAWEGRGQIKTHVERMAGKFV